ncbi:MAG: LCP family protein [Symploca sp. SIO3C6]|uniref:LCP family protein n=1 Tax=Symploca sp. SIO1C4 TaxID=2607765 RepID=A0A6B3N748_9CYAN|nr:LCP family protein [Symploca sp. SIO3C6]NER26645.1 LCP family protein [Symploca sp. SIO1C4]NET06253.1 LCP family protein [Symploca sp. SIO2B6]
MGFTGIAMLSATAGAMLAVSLSSMPLLQTKLSPAEKAVFANGESISRSSMRLPELTRPVNVLVLGTKVLTSDLDEKPVQDLGYHALVNSFDGLSDTMLLLRFAPDQEKLTVLSIPRDTRTYVPGIGRTKLNAANYHGGPALTARATSDLLGGVGIDRYIRVNVQGVEKLIDALGGVTVYVPKDMKYTDHSQHLYINLKEGKQRLNGEQALQFLRFRYDQYGDVGRVQRQQIFMRAMIEQVLNPTTLARVPKILSVIQSNLDTNLTVEELVALVGFGAGTKRSNTQMLLVPGQFSGTGHSEVSYWLPDRRRIRQMMARHFDIGYSDEQEINPSYLRIAIQDSTDEPEAVKALVKTLREAGYRNIYISDRWSETLQTTRIVAQQGDSRSADDIRSYLRLGEVRIESTGSLTSDVTIQLGQDWLEQPDPTDNELLDL